MECCSAAPEWERISADATVPKWNLRRDSTCLRRAMPRVCGRPFFLESERNDNPRTAKGAVYPGIGAGFGENLFATTQTEISKGDALKRATNGPVAKVKVGRPS